MTSKIITNDDILTILLEQTERLFRIEKTWMHTKLKNDGKSKNVNDCLKSIWNMKLELLAEFLRKTSQRKRQNSTKVDKLSKDQIKKNFLQDSFEH